QRVLAGAAVVAELLLQEEARLVAAAQPEGVEVSCRRAVADDRHRVGGRVLLQGGQLADHGAVALGGPGRVAGPVGPGAAVPPPLPEAGRAEVAARHAHGTVVGPDAAQALGAGGRDGAQGPNAARVAAGLAAGAGGLADQVAAATAT